MKWKALIIVIFLSITIPGIMSQLNGVERTMEQFLDGLLHHSVYDRRIRPFSNIASKIFFLYNFILIFTFFNYYFR